MGDLHEFIGGLATPASCKAQHTSFVFTNVNGHEFKSGLGNPSTHVVRRTSFPFVHPNNGDFIEPPPIRNKPVEWRKPKRPPPPKPKPAPPWPTLPVILTPRPIP